MYNHSKPLLSSPFVGPRRHSSPPEAVRVQLEVVSDPGLCRAGQGRVPAQLSKAMRTLNSTQTHLQDTVILLQEVGHNSKSLVNSLEELNSKVLWRPPPPSDFRCVHTLYGEYVNENCSVHL